MSITNPYPDSRRAAQLASFSLYRVMILQYVVLGKLLISALKRSGIAFP